MPGLSSAIVVGGGINAVAPLVVDNGLFLSNVTPPEANTSPRLIRRATSIEILGDGTTSTAIGVSADANGTDHIAIGRSITTVGGAVSQMHIGNDITPSGAGNNVILIGSGTASVNPGSDAIAIGYGVSVPSGNLTSTVLVGHGATSSGAGTNNCVGLGHSVDVLGANAVAVGSGAAARQNCTVVGSQSSTGTGLHQIVVGTNAAGPNLNNFINVGNRQSAAGTISAGDIILGHQDNANSIFSLNLWLGGGPDHLAATAVPAFTVRGRQASGTDIAAGDITFFGSRATGNAAPGSFVFQTTAAGASGATQQAFTARLTIGPASAGMTMTAPTATGVTLTIGGFGGAGVPSLRFDNLTTGAGAGVGTLTNAPTAGDPAFWLPVNIAGAVRYIPCWP